MNKKSCTTNYENIYQTRKKKEIQKTSTRIGKNCNLPQILEALTPLNPLMRQILIFSGSPTAWKEIIL